MTTYYTPPAYLDQHHSLRGRCGHNCGCEYARRGELCDAGEDKAERIKDARGTIDALATVLSLLPVAPLALAHWLGWWWAGIGCAWLAVTAVVICCCVQAGRSEGWER